MNTESPGPRNILGVYLDLSLPAKRHVFPPNRSLRWSHLVGGTTLAETQTELFLTVLADPKDGHGAVVQGADLLPEGPEALLVRRLVDRQHLLHLSQRVQQVVSGRTLLRVGQGHVRGPTMTLRVGFYLFFVKAQRPKYREGEGSPLSNRF